MAWLQIDQTIRDHHKIIDAADELDTSAAHVTGCLVLLWLWAIDNAPDGCLAGISDAAIVRAAQWDGEKSRFIEALKDVGLLDQTEEGLQIHNWQDRAGNLIDRRKADAERKRRERAEKKARELPETGEAPAGHPSNVRTQSRVDQSIEEQRRAEQTRTGGHPPKAPGGPEEIPAAAAQTFRRSSDGNLNASGVTEHNTTEHNTTDRTEQTEQHQQSDAAPSIQEQRFAEFWQLYPKKVGKADALKAWKLAKVTAELFERILDALSWQKESEQWHRDGGRFIPNPSTWINQGRWDNEPTEIPNGSARTGRAEAGGGTLDTLRRMIEAEEAAEAPTYYDGSL